MNLDALIIGFAIAIILLVLLLIFDDRPELAAAIREWISGIPQYHMSSWDADRADDPVCDPVHVPVHGPIDELVQTTGEPAVDIISIPIKPTHEQLIRALARLQDANGKPYLSANNLEKLKGGTRTDVLRWVREERTSGPAPVYHPPKPENEQKYREARELVEQEA